MTLHINNHLHTGAPQPTQETAAAHILNQPTNQLRKPCIKLHHIPEDPKAIHTQKEIQESQQMIYKWTFTVQMIIPVVQKKTQTILTSGALSQ